MDIAIKRRNWTIDFLKLIAAFFIIFIHVPFEGELGIVITNVARFAVPVFFITSGYFCYGNDVEKIRNKQLHIIHIFVFASLLYNACNLAMHAINDGVQGIWVYLRQFINMEELIQLIVFNDTISATRLWFLPALIYVYAVQRIAIKRGVSVKYILIVSVILLGINLFFAEVLLILGKTIPAYFTRNFLLTGYPLFGIGLGLRQYKNIVSSISVKVLVSCVLLGLVYAVVSVFLLTPTELSIGAVLVAVSAFIIAMKCSDVDYSNGYKKLFQCSLGIYILHKPITLATNIVGTTLGISGQIFFDGYLLPILVCIFTTICVLILNMFPKLKRV